MVQKKVLEKVKLATILYTEGIVACWNVIIISEQWLYLNFLQLA